MKIGDCFWVEVSYGDARPSWRVYRRVRRQIAGWVECHRFETRCDEIRMMSPADPIPIGVLEAQERMTEEEWAVRWELWAQDVNQPWNAE
jgi:hypothetical protein